MKTSNSPTHTENYLESMENQLSWSGILSLDSQSWRFFKEIQENVDVRHINPEQFEDRIIFMSMLNDMDWTEKGNSAQCLSKSEEVKNYATRFLRGHWSFLDPGEEEATWYGTHTYKSEGPWNKTADVMLENFQESGHSIFRGISTSNRGVLKRKGGRSTVPFNMESRNADLVFRTIQSVNQLCIKCGAVAQLIPVQTRLIMEKSVAKENVQVISKIGAVRSGFFGTDTKEG